MSRRLLSPFRLNVWTVRVAILLSLCSVALFLVPNSGAQGTLKVDESKISILLAREPAEVLLPIENLAQGELRIHIFVELINPLDQVVAKTDRVESLRQNQTVSLPVPFSVSKLKEKERSQLPWLRLRYQLTSELSARTLANGIVSVSQIAPELFEVRVVTSTYVQEGSRYGVRVQTFNPARSQPVPGVRIRGKVTLQHNDRDVRLEAFGSTDSAGYAKLHFQIPPRFPEFPHEAQASGGELHVVAQRGALTAELTNDVLVNQFANILVTTDKPIYQPGQALHARALVLTPSRKVLANQTVLFRVTDHNEVTVFQASTTTSRFGIASIDWPIANNTKLGNYNIRVSFSGSDQDWGGWTKVMVNRYELPNFSVTVQPNRKYYLPGQSAEVRVNADYLFGRAVTRGKVRIFRERHREWNYEEQKWNVDEGESIEGELDANGSFVGRLNLKEHYDELVDSSDYNRFDDITFAAYVTDSSTNRTEQRRFDIRVTKEPIHVYLVTSQYEFDQTGKLPLEFFVSSFYADGSPAQCTVDVRLMESDDTTSARLRIRTNKYGFGKVDGLRLTSALDDSDVDIALAARDVSGKKGTAKEDLDLDDDERLTIKTDKSLYRAGDPITAHISANFHDQFIIVDLASTYRVLHSQRLKLRAGRTQVTFPYSSDFQDKLTIAAYPDLIDSQDSIATRTVLYPKKRDLTVVAHPEQKSYRPGESARVNLQVQAPRGSLLESALGVIVVDSAVNERARTDREFSGNNYRGIEWFLGDEEQLGGVTLNSLRRLEMSKPVPPDLELIAEALLNQSWVYFPDFESGESYVAYGPALFGQSISSTISQLKMTLAQRYATARDYPREETTLRRILSNARIHFDQLRDPWGIPFRPVFMVDKQMDRLELKSAGADKQFDTADDFNAAVFVWPYFQPIGEAIGKATREYHQRTGGFIRDRQTLNEEVSKLGISIANLRDRWGTPYEFKFGVLQTTYTINVQSAGPDKRLEEEIRYLNDDFTVWTNSIDYFAEVRAQISSALSRWTSGKHQFPKDKVGLAAALGDSGIDLSTLRDPWGRPYEPHFTIRTNYADRTTISSGTNSTNGQVDKVNITPITQQVGVIVLRSLAADGRLSGDDIDVASFTNVLSEQEASQIVRKQLGSSIVMSDNTGAIAGIVTDSIGAAVSGAAVLATVNSQTFETTTRDDGSYSISNLPPGIYQVAVVAAGFKKHTLEEVSVTPSNIAALNIALEPGEATETVTVSASAPTIQTHQILDLPMSSRSTIQFAGLRSRIQVVTKSGSNQQSFTPRLREYFPETLLWQPELTTDSKGRAQLDFKLADNITTWKMSVIGSNENGEIGTAETEIRAFQPFFAELDPPRVLTEGDRISLPVVLRNYLDRKQNVDLEMKPENWFSLHSGNRKRAEVPAGDNARATFDLQAVASIQDGKQRVTAIGSDSSDAIEKVVTVHPDGEERSETTSDILDSSTNLTINLPEDTISKSARVELKVYPNLLTHVWESVEGIMQRPYGCAEQTISAAYPSLLVLRFKNDEKPTQLSVKARRYLEAGIQKLLNYQDDSGGFTYWGHGNADIALTAYAVRFLNEASSLTSVDRTVVEKAQSWLLERQRKNGSWPARHWDKEENETRNSMVTALVARSLAQTPVKNPIVESSVSSALAYLGERSERMDEPYLIASYSLVASLTGQTAQAAKANERLRGLVHSATGVNYWNLETNTPFYGWGTAGRIETTGLVLQALMNNRIPDTEKLESGALLFLLRKKDRYGVWYSTQATVNVLEAMLSFLTNRVMNADAGAPKVEVIVNGRPFKTLTMTRDDQMFAPDVVDLSSALKPGANRIELRSSGAIKTASLQVVSNYYVPWQTSAPKETARVQSGDSEALKLEIRCDKFEARVMDEITCQVKAERIGFRGYGMMLAEIGLPPGADVDRASLESAVRKSDWTIGQYDVLPDRVVVYLWPRAVGSEFTFKFRPRMAMTAKASPSSIYDYYNPEARAVVAPSTFVIR